MAWRIAYARPGTRNAGRAIKPAAAAGGGMLWQLFIACAAGRFEPRHTRAGLRFRQLVGEMHRLEMDHREYRLLRLTNGMEVLVGRDVLYSKAIAVMDVAVGMRHEPPELRGLAHLCEHMLGMGSDRYPDANDYASVS